ncbi:MAG: hypothetical protein WDW36_006544 [Sanguina aurantia]
MASISILGSSPPGTDDPEEVEDDADLCVGFDPEEDMDEEEEDIDVSDNGGTQDEDTNRFDEVVGCLAEVLMDSDFVAVKDAFCRGNCSHFESSGENKLIYTQLFDQYSHLLETEINARLLRILPTFSMPHFLALLTTRHEQLDPEMSDLLESMADFEEFKGVMVSHRAEADAAAVAAVTAAVAALAERAGGPHATTAEQSGGVGGVSDGGGGKRREATGKGSGGGSVGQGGDVGFCISCSAMPIHTEEQEDGEARPELDFALTVSGLRVGGKRSQHP